jgi:hypothetical protein
VSHFVGGLDLGQAADYTALAIVECVPPALHLRHLQRFKLGTTYPAVVEGVRALLLSPALLRDTVLVVDHTGVGRPVVDLLQAARLAAPLVPVTITGGDAVTYEGDCWRVPKRNLVATVQVVLQTGRLKIAEGLPEAAMLVKELLNFQVKITANAHDTYGAWREGSHDDLVLAVALACWYAERASGIGGSGIHI